MAQIVTILYICKSSRDVVYASSLICLHSQELFTVAILETLTSIQKDKFVQFIYMYVA